ncbi:MAG: argininosuccinate lyase [Candidatus Melainabacteria bacterium]|nr:argininosuccinate lyase [Candidatus Melainabacteria bacterium]
MVDHAPEFDQVRRFWQNPKVEQILAIHDIKSSLAHVRMLGQTGIITQEVTAAVLKGLDEICQELGSGKNFLAADGQDIHMGLERRLQAIVGDLAMVLRIAKSRNDQIATDIRLWLREAIFDVFADVCLLRQLLLDLAQRDLDVVMPGYTHMQPAMPILLAHWWLANEARFRRDFGRLVDLYGRLNVLPLGSCALAGTNQPIDRALVAEYLGFAGVMENSLDAVSDRDYLIEFASFASIVGVHLSQMSADLLLWATQEFGFVKLRKAYVFRSQSMPQKRNPELLEVLRSRPSVIYGRVTEFLSQLKALPMGYCQDLQESLPGLLDVVENLKFVLELAQILLPGLEFDSKRMEEAASADLTNASNAMDFLVVRGIPQDKASRIVEALVNYCKQRGRYLSDLELNEWQQFSPAFDDEVYQHVTLEESVGSRSSFGGTSQQQVAQALERARDALGADRNILPQVAAQRLETRLRQGVVSTQT